MCSNNCKKRELNNDDDDDVDDDVRNNNDNIFSENIKNKIENECCNKIVFKSNKKLKTNEANLNTSVTSKRFFPLKNLSIKAESSFKSPLMNRASSSQINLGKNKTSQIDKKSLESNVVQLEAKLNDVNNEIEKLNKYSVSDLDNIMKKLHIYNDIKDFAQIIMGKIANIKCITIKQVHDKYDANSNEIN